MNKRGAGVVFCLISAFLLASKKGIHYISAAIIGSDNNGTLGSETFRNLLSNYTQEPFSNTVIILPLVVGISYLIWAEIDENIFKKR